MNKLSDHSDAELLGLISTDNAAAFETIYRRYAAGLYRYARRNVSVGEDCEEIVQEVFESLWKRRGDLSHVGTLGGYLFRMVKYKLIRYFQKNAVHKKYAQHYAMFEAIYDGLQEEESPSDHLLQRIEKSIDQLPERCQLAVKLRLTENLSNSDIAARMNIKKSTVENYMVTAISHLRAVHASFG